jgi:hypothetical protein
LNARTTNTVTVHERRDDRRVRHSDGGGLSRTTRSNFSLSSSRKRGKRSECSTSAGFGGVGPAGTHHRFGIFVGCATSSRVASGEGLPSYSTGEGLCRANDYGEWLQEQEDRTGDLYKLELAQRAKAKHTSGEPSGMGKWLAAWYASRRATGHTATRENESHVDHHITKVFGDKHVRTLPSLPPRGGRFGRAPFQTVHADFPHTAYRRSLAELHYAASG